MLPARDGKLESFDDGGQWTRRQPFTDCGAGLVSTVSDYLTFARMLLSGGTLDGRRILSPGSAAAMTADYLTAGQTKDLAAVLFTQVLVMPGGSTIEADFWSGVYQALA